MIFRRLLLALVAAATFATGAAVAVVALAFALYALAEPRLGRPGAAAVVALATAVPMMIGGLLMARAGRKKPPIAAASSPMGLIEKAIGFLQEKPVMAAAAAVAAGILAIRDPTYLGAVLRAFMDGNPPRK